MSEYAIKAVRGDTLGPLTFICKNEDGTRFDLTGSVIIMRIKTGGPDLILSSAIDDGLEVTNPVQGETTLTLSPTQTTQLLLNKNSTYRLRRVIGQDVKTLVFGVFDVAPGDVL